MGVLFSLLISPIALADPPPDPKEQSVPVQLRLIRGNLVLMEERLSQQMTDMEGRLDSTMADIQSSVNVGNGKLDVLQSSADDIYDVVTAVNVELTTTLCLDEGVTGALDGGAHGEFGVGWPNVLDAKAILQGNAGFAVGVGVGNQICIEIPLYSVASNLELLNSTNWDTTEFDEMVAFVGGAAQTVMPFYAAIYGELMPTPAQAIEALDNVISASTGFNIYDGKVYPGDVDLEMLAHPDLMLDPIIPPFIDAFIANAPSVALQVVNDPCGALRKSPLGSALDIPELNWLCKANAKAINDIFGWLEEVYSWVKAIFNWLP